MKMPAFKFSLLLIALMLLSGCAKDLSTNAYEEANVGATTEVYKGVIIEIRQVKVKGNSGVGAVAGGATGAIAGSSVGGGKGSSIAAIAGGVLGGVLGHKVDEQINSQVADQYMVQLDKGEIVAVVQTGGSFSIGQRVMVLKGKESKIIPDRTQ